MNQSAAARALGLARSSFQYHRDRGRIVIGADGELDVEATKAKLRATTDAEQSTKGRQNSGSAEEGRDKSPPLWKAKEATERIREQLLQMELDEKRGVLIPRADVEVAYRAKLLMARAAFLAIPARVIAVLRAAETEDEAKALLDAEIRAVMRMLAGETK